MADTPSPTHTTNRRRRLGRQPKHSRSIPTCVARTSVASARLPALAPHEHSASRALRRALPPHEPANKAASGPGYGSGLLRILLGIADGDCGRRGGRFRGPRPHSDGATGADQVRSSDGGAWAAARGHEQRAAAPRPPPGVALPAGTYRVHAEGWEHCGRSGRRLAAPLRSRADRIRGLHRPGGLGVSNRIRDTTTPTHSGPRRPPTPQLRPGARPRGPRQVGRRRRDGVLAATAAGQAPMAPAQALPGARRRAATGSRARRGAGRPMPPASGPCRRQART